MLQKILLLLQLISWVSPGFKAPQDSYSPDTKQKWRMGLVYYKYAQETDEDKMFTDEEKKGIREAMDHIVFQLAPGCIRFIYRPDTNLQHLLFTKEIEKYKCSTDNIGRVEAKDDHGNYMPSILRLSKECFQEKGTVAHEIMHALGAIHEQNRLDRDFFVEIDWSNIKEESKGNFMEKKDLDDAKDYLKKVEAGKQPTKRKDLEIYSETFGTAYDFYSLMHYSVRQAAIDNEKDVIKIPEPFKKKFGPALLEGKPEKMSAADVMELSAHYNGCGVKPKVKEEYVQYLWKLAEASVEHMEQMYKTDETKNKERLEAGPEIVLKILDEIELNGSEEDEEFKEKFEDKHSQWLS